MPTDLGTFTPVAEIRRGVAGAFFFALLAFAAFGGAGLAVGRWSIGLLAPVAATAVFLIDRRRRRRAVAAGIVELDREELVLRRGDRVLHRLRLRDARFVGRTQSAGSERARLQIVVIAGERAIVAHLAVAFRAADGDEDGLLPATIELDRKASRAFDALSYERPERRAGAVRPTAPER
jgi:hypothetical protein